MAEEKDKGIEIDIPGLKVKIKVAPMGWRKIDKFMCAYYLEYPTDRPGFRKFKNKRTKQFEYIEIATQYEEDTEGNNDTGGDKN